MLILLLAFCGDGGQRHCRRTLPHRWRRGCTGEILHQRARLGKRGTLAEASGPGFRGRPASWAAPPIARLGRLPSGGASLALVAGFGCYAGGVAFTLARMPDSRSRLSLIVSSEPALIQGRPPTTAHRALTAVTLPIPVSNREALCPIRRCWDGPGVPVGC